MSNDQESSDLERAGADRTTEVAAVAKVKKQPKERTGAIGLLLMSLIIILMGVAGGVAAFFFWQFVSALKVEQGALVQVVERQEQIITPLSKQLSEVTGHNQQVAGKLSALEQQVLSVRKQSESVLQKIASLDGVHRNDWLIAEVEHYIKLANQRIELTHDASGAARLLRQSVDVARAVEVPGIIALRETLLADQHALLQVANVDVEAIYLELSVLNRQVDSLIEPTFKWSFKSTNKDEGGVGDEVNSEAGETTGWDYTWGQWRRFITENLIRHRTVERPVEPLMPPDQMAFLRQNVRLMISQAQLAVMRGEGKNYHVAVQQAHSWIAQYYEPSHASTQGLLKALGRLASIDIQPQLPNIDASLIAVRRLREHWMEIKAQDVKQRAAIPQSGSAEIAFGGAQ